MFNTKGGPQQGLLKAQLKLSKSHLTASQTDLNLWRSTQQREHIANNLPAEPEDAGVSCGRRWAGETMRLHVQTLAVNVFFFNFWWKTTLSLTRTSPFSHTEQFNTSLVFWFSSLGVRLTLASLQAVIRSLSSWGLMGIPLVSTSW